MKGFLKNWNSNISYLLASIFYFIGAMLEQSVFHINLFLAVLASLAILIGLAFVIVGVLTDA